MQNEHSAAPAQPEASMLAAEAVPASSSIVRHRPGRSAPGPASRAGEQPMSACAKAGTVDGRRLLWSGLGAVDVTAEVGAEQADGRPLGREDVVSRPRV